MNKNIGHIPRNVNDFGYILGGMVKVRSAIEASVGLILVLMLIKCLGFLSLFVRLLIGLILGGIVIAISLIGMEGVPFTTYIQDYFMYRRSRGNYIYKVPRPNIDNPKSKNIQRRKR